jgi:hypothetical protein
MNDKLIKVYIDGQTGIATEVELTAEEITAREENAVIVKEKTDAFQAKLQAKADNKASAKAKLIAGEALTEDEANTIVL